MLGRHNAVHDTHKLKPWVGHDSAFHVRTERLSRDWRATCTAAGLCRQLCGYLARGLAHSAKEVTWLFHECNRKAPLHTALLSVGSREIQHAPLSLS